MTTVANDCLNRIAITAPMERLEYLLRGPSLLEHLLDTPVKEPEFDSLLDALAQDEADHIRLNLVGDCLSVVYETRRSPNTRSVATFARRHPDLRIVHSSVEPLMAAYTRDSYVGGKCLARVSYGKEADARAAFSADGWDYEGDFRLNTAICGAMAARMWAHFQPKQDGRATAQGR